MLFTYHFVHFKMIVRCFGKLRQFLGGIILKKALRFICTVLVISLIATLFAQTVCLADTVSDVDASVTVNATETGYSDYLEGKKDYEGAPITVAASNFAAAEGSSAKLGSYCGKDNVLIIDSESGPVSFTTNCDVAALYNVALNYAAVDNNDAKIEVSCKINGVEPFSEADSMFLPRVWVDDGKPTEDALGNQSSPSQIQKPQWVSEKLIDPDELFLEPLKFGFNAGANTITIELYSGTIALESLTLCAAEKAAAYNKESVSGIYDGENIVIEAQDAVYKNSKELRPLADGTDPSLNPSSAYHTSINCIGGNNWDAAGEKITWEFNAPKDAYYSITFKYKQGYLTNASSIRSLQIDGKTPFAEASEIKFPYNTKWDLLTFGGETPYYVYLEEGTHTISLKVTLGSVADISRRLETLIYNVGEMYRQIIMITGTTPDANRDYRLYEQIPTLTEDLKSYIEQIGVLVGEYNSITGAKGGSNAVTLETLALVLQRMLDSKFKAHKYVGDLFNNYSSAGAWIYEMRKMPLDIEKIIIAGESVDKKDYKSNFIDRFVFGFNKLLASYIVDYNSLSTAEGENVIDVWVNIGRDQSKVLQKMVDDSFTPKTGIKANVKIAAASIIQAKLSGNAPDCTIMQTNDAPVNLAMRGALYDLSKFDDFEEILQRNYGSDKPVNPFRYKGGVYGLADSITFNMMYVRDDIFQQLELSVPKTWDEFLRCCAVLMRNNLSVGVPLNYRTFLYQKNGTLYTDDLAKTNLSTAQAFDAFNFYTDLYVEYKLPVAFSLYNRFRTGEMPLGIEPYTSYATLMAAAPEISGRWSVHSLPGFENEDGFNNKTIGTPTATVMLNDTEKPKAAWEFLKWWTSAETQYRYSSDVESIVGIAARVATANKEALQLLSWSRDDAKVILKQYELAEFIPEVPGSYYVNRSLENAFYAVYTDGDAPKDALTKWALMIDEEMERKSKEYADK